MLTLGRKGDISKLNGNLICTIVRSVMYFLEYKLHELPAVTIYASNYYWPYGGSGEQVLRGLQWSKQHVDIAMQ